MGAKAHSRYKANAAGPLLLLLVLALLWGWGLVVQAAYVEESLAAERGRDQVAALLRRAETALGDRALDHAWQDEAAQRLDVPDSAALRWAESHILRPAEEAADLSAAAVADGTGRIALVHIDRRPAGDRAAQAVLQGVAPLAARAMKAPSGKPVVASGLVMLDRRVHLVAAVRITPVRRAMAEPPDAVLVLTQDLSDVVLPAIALAGDWFPDIALLAEAPDGMPNLPLRAADGSPLGVLVWTMPKAGRELVTASLPLLLGGSLLLAAITWLLARGRRRKVGSSSRLPGSAVVDGREP